MNQIINLSQKIKDAQIAYYNGSSIIDDDEYDALVYELQSLDPKNCVLLQIGASPTTEWKKEKHLYPLGSLEKVNTPTEMTNWINSNLYNQQTIVIEKLDGLSLGCQYEDGKLIKCILRGNGHEGEDILSNVVKMDGVIHSITNFNGVIRGEIILKKSNHINHFSDYSNPRNAASGLCRNLKGTRCEYLTLMAYDVMSDEEFKTEADKLAFLINSGFKVPNYSVCDKAEDINDIWKIYQDTVRDSLDYEIDGLVVYCNDLAFQESLGVTNLKPKGKMAFKFANQFAPTTVTKITWVTGDSGRITPIGWFEKINLLGSDIEKASLYNVAYINNIGVDVGAKVLVCKANEIIPRIEKVTQSTGSVALVPHCCDSCATEIEIVGEYLICPNSLNCQAQVIGRLKNWIKELNILEWGEALLDRLVTSGKVTTIADLYKLSVKDLATLDRMGEKSAKKCHDILWADTTLPLDIFLGALSIPMIGGSTIRAIMSTGNDTLDKIMSMSVSDLEKVPGLGPNKAKSLYDGLVQNKKLIKELLGLGIKIKEKVMGSLSGKSFVFTGALSQKRPILEKMVTDAGGVVKSGVSKDLMFLVSGDADSNSSKSVKAKSLGIKVIGEEEFMKMLK